VIALSLQVPSSEGTLIEDYHRIALSDDVSDAEVRKALTLMLRDWRGRGDGATLIAGGGRPSEMERMRKERSRRVRRMNDERS
jgi:hypothetical protein